MINKELDVNLDVNLEVGKIRQKALSLEVIHCMVCGLAQEKWKEKLNSKDQLIVKLKK